MNPLLRPLRGADVADVTRIFNEALLRGDNTFDSVERSTDAMRAWLTAVEPKYEAWVAVAEATLVGFGAVTRHHEREAYSPTVEMSVFVRAAFRTLGVGTALGQQLLNRGASLGFHSAVALTNASPIAARFVIGLGFFELGKLDRVHPLGDERRDVVLFQRFFDGAAP